MVKKIILFSTGILFGSLVLIVLLFTYYKSTYKNKIYPGVFANQIPVEGLDENSIFTVVDPYTKTIPNLDLTLLYNEKYATISADILTRTYNTKLTFDQALSVGRSGNLSSDTFFIVRSLISKLGKSDTPIVNLPLQISYNSAPVDELVTQIEDEVQTDPIEPQFDFDPSTKKVTTFRLGTNGSKLDTQTANYLIYKALTDANLGSLLVLLPIVTISPKTSDIVGASYGIEEKIGSGYSFFKGSIPGRIHNIALASSRINGTLVAPNETFSFNGTVGDVSYATGYESAYIIKNGKTILGDGGGVCQVSSTLYRAALNSGFEIIERHPHSYRVGYYEQGGFKPGLDASVIAPTADFTFINNTPNHILIQSVYEPKLNKLTFDIFGTNDERKVELGDITYLSQTSPPPDVYQDDPTKPLGTLEQVEQKAWGAKTKYTYRVTKNGQILIDKTISSVYKPWAAVYLKGTL